MNRLPAIVHRLSVGLLGILLIVIGVGAVASRTGLAPIDGWIDRIDTEAIGDVADSGWWTLVLVAVVLVAVGWAFVLISSAVRPGAVDDLDLAGSDESGALTVAPKLIASAVADELATDPLFVSVSARALNDRARSIIRLEVTARSDRTYPEVADRVAAAAKQVRTAVAGSGVHVQTFVHFEKR